MREENIMKNKIAKNRTSPKNEQSLIAEYNKLNVSAKKQDGYDVSAVVDKDGTKGHALMKESFNRSRDDNYHRVKDFIPDDEL